MEAKMSRLRQKIEVRLPQIRAYGTHVVAPKRSGRSGGRNGWGDARSL
jgi:hypothetical protein